MIEIHLTRGYTALISDEDAPRVLLHTWRAAVRRHTVYAITDTRNPETGRRATIYLHQLITGARAPLHVDHYDRNGLNCQRSNLRVTTSRENLAWRPGWGACKYRGVTLDRRRDKKPYYARHGDRYLGAFDTVEEAARAVDAYTLAEYGPFAFLNFEDARPAAALEAEQIPQWPE